MTARAPILFLALLAAPLAAQSNAERMANDAYSRSHDYDLIHQRIELRNFEWDSTAFDGIVATTLVALRPDFDSVIVDAGKLLDIRSVADPRGQSLLFGRSGDTLVVRLPRPVAFRDTVRFTITYRGRVENGRGLTFIPAEPGTPHRPQQIWSQGESSDNHLWFPTYDFPNDKMIWELEATVPARYTVVSNGRLSLDRRNPGGTRTMRWAQQKPSATYLVSLVVAPLVKIGDIWRGVPVDYYVYREDSALARPLFRVTPDMIEVYTRLTGVKYPWAKYAQTTVADFFGGMENVSATTLVDWLPDRRAYLDRPWYQYILIPHELAHQWFGDYVTTANWANMWLNEGFAEFMPCQYWREKGGAAAEEDCFSGEYDSFMRIDRRRRMPLASNGSNNIYPKGALVLRMLQRHLGRERFWAAIHDYLTTHALGTATSDDLRQAVLRATGENLDWFWDQWVYQAGYPEFVVAAKWDSAGRNLALAVKQVQQDSSKADSTGLRFTTPAVFRMPLSVRVGTTAGDVTWRGWIDQREEAIEIPNVASAPTMVVFDEGNAILKTLTFDQPTSWLAVQLERDSDLWNRAWVIGQLAKRPADTAAVQALARAATGANYVLTRAQAAGALSGAPAGLAVPPLLTALGDTSAAVRAAAAGALGELHAMEALAELRGRWAGDPSYEVRAAALGSLILLDEDNRRGLIAEGLRTESYRDAIRNAALGGVLHTADTTFIPTLDSLATRDGFAAYALGILGNRGAPAALDRLAVRLDDPRPSVRKRALEAFAEAVEPPLALKRLESIAAGLRYSDIREGVERLLTKQREAERLAPPSR